MSKNVADLCFRVAHAGHFSSEWRFWITRHGDIYLATRSLAGRFKLSFHRSGINRYAHTSQSVAASQGNRLHLRWQVPDLPAPNSNHFARLAWIAVPTDYLSLGTVSPRGGAALVPPAPSGQAVFFEVGLTAGARDDIDAAMGAGSDRGMLLFAHVPQRASAFVRWYHGAWENNDLRVRAPDGSPLYRFVSPENEQPRRPQRFFVLSTPRNRDAILITELGGCRDAP